MIEGLGIIRHGEKLGLGEVRKPLEESGLSPEQQTKWAEAQERLNLADPEITYSALPKIEKMARDIYTDLPENALVVFTSTMVPRARFTADLISTELSALAFKDHKNIGVAFVWEPKEEAIKSDSLTNIPLYPPEIGEAMANKIREVDAAADGSLMDYLRTDNASRTHPMEDELTFQVMNEDLARPDSFMKRRAELLKEQVTKLEQTFGDEDRPVFFYGVGHHSSLVALDVAFHGTTHYASAEEMPKPLSLWKTNLKKTQ